MAVTAASIPAVHNGDLNGVMLAALALLAMASFEAITPLSQAAAVIDATDEAAGRIEEVTLHQEGLFDRLAGLPQPWAQGDKPHVMRLVPASIQGRRVTGDELPPPP
mgnify:CR=1 FL=1